MNVIRFFIGKYPYIHQLQTIYIDKQTRDIYVDVDNPIYKFTTNSWVLTGWFDKLWMNIFGTFKVDLKSVEEIHNIVVESRNRNVVCKCRINDEQRGLHG